MAGVPTSIFLTYTKAIVKTGKRITLDTYVEYSDGSTDKRFSYVWSGDGSILPIDTVTSTTNPRTLLSIEGSHLGIVDLTVYSTVDNSIKKTCRIEVVPNAASNDVHPVIGLLITGSLKLNVGEVGTIDTSLYPVSPISDRTITFVSSDTSVATVDSRGNVTGVSKGLASVTVTAGSYSLVCDVAVGDVSFARSISVSRDSLVITRGSSEMITLVVTDKYGKRSLDERYGIRIDDEAVVKQDGRSSDLTNKNYFISFKGTNVGATDVRFYSPEDPSVYATVHVVVVASEDDKFNPVVGVTVSKTFVTVPPNSKFDLVGSQQLKDDSGVIRDDGNVTFATSNTNIARYSNSYVQSTFTRVTIYTGHEEGSAKIYVTSNHDNTKKAVCVVNVVASASPTPDDETIINPVVSVSISEDSLEIAEGDYRQLTATVIGQYSDQSGVNRSVLWGSSDTGVVSVNSSGRIIGVSEGTAIITAVSDEDHNIWDSCYVTVRKREESDGPAILPDEKPANGIDTIIRVDYKEDGTFEYVKLFEGDLDFDAEHPIESVVYHETDEIQKIYWVDGKNVLRFMNFMEEPNKTTGLYPWQLPDGSYDNTYFDSNRAISFGVDVKITKDNSGNTRPNGVVQYLLTYYNKHGQESGYAWISDLVYLSPVASGGAADGTNNNAVSLIINNLDTRFSHFRIYSVFRSALNGTTVSYIVFEGKTTSESVIVIDNNSHLTAIDSSRLLYLGSQHVIADTLTHKDQTLFLGGFGSVDRDYDDVEKAIRRSMINEGWESLYVKFDYDSNEIPNEVGDGNYSYNSQLVKSSSEITSFKGGEKYRFGIVFHKKDGTLTDAFWIGDKVNHLYPKMTDAGIRRIIAKCTLPPEVVQIAKKKGYMTAQLMIAEATYADRSIKAQGIVCPTVFNVWNRYMDRMYSASSWMMRPRNAEYAWKHFEPIHNSISSTGEIDCNYWETENDPAPYYSLLNYATKKEYAEKFDGESDYEYALIIYRIFYNANPTNHYYAGATVILIKDIDGVFNPSTYQFSGNVLNTINSLGSSGDQLTITYNTGGLKIQIANFKNFGGVYVDKPNTTKSKAWTGITKAIREKFGFLGANELVEQTNFYAWCNKVSDDYSEKTDIFFNKAFGNSPYVSITEAVNDIGGSHGIGRWIMLADESPSGATDDYIPAYRKKHLSFIDENIVTLNSPEIEHEAISFDKVDGYEFRIIGIAKIDGQYSDYTVDASPSKIAGESLVKEKFSNTLISWPLWKEYGLDERTLVEGGQSDHEEDEYTPPQDIKDRSSYDYVWSGAVVRYWLHMWNHSDKIPGYTDYDNNDYSRLIRKVFANSRYSNKTVYCSNMDGSWSCTPDSIRIFNYTSSQYVSINIDDSPRNYDAVVNDSLMPPSNHKYPVLYSVGAPSPEQVLEKQEEPFLYLSDPVSITYSSTPHAVISLPTDIWINGTKKYYRQTILPYLNSSERFSNDTSHSDSDTGRLLPWIDNKTSGSYPYLDYYVNQDPISGLSVSDGEQYVFIGEIYSVLEDNDQIRYGGTSDAAIQNSRFIIAGPQVRLSEMVGNGQDALIANQGDTYIQRWDCLKTKPYSTSSVNNVIDITSVMLETHINIDGRTDLQRGTSYIASIDAEKWDSLNPVYSQNNNFITQRDLDEDFNLDAYRSSITWTLEKHDSEDVDAWTHITLASTLKLDGDKGWCRALRRMGNSIIAFQDRGISEILFNSRTQLSTQDGVPVEIANSGKVDGKRYITNKYGCTNKWSIIEGKNALYFVDNINKAFCAFNGQAIDNLSTRLGFGAWFREINKTKPWNPEEFDNIISHYDKVHSDIYLVRDTEGNKPCLVYNETLGAFTSFFDYSEVPMIANVKDRLVSFRDNRLWLQNEGLYCNFFGHQYDYWTQYRVTPEPFSDKIWTNIDYRADFFEVLDNDAEPVVSETELINGDIEDTYKEWETFTDYKVWDEYQDTGFTPFAHDSFDRDDVRKKFRIWRLTIPRALKEGTNKHGMDRIRNPWINLLFRKNNVDGKYLMQLHDIVVKYFE